MEKDKQLCSVSISDSPVADEGSNFNCYWESVKVELSLAESPPCTSDPMNLQKQLLTRRFKVTILKGTKRTTLYRFLLARLCYGPEKGEGLSIEEYLTLYELYDSLSQETLVDPNTSAKYGDFLQESLPILQVLGKARSFPIRLSEENRRKIEKHLSPVGQLPTRSAYYGLLGQRSLRGSFSVTFSSPIAGPLPQKRFIGVGYKDKGSRRIPSEDASPSWQEVASSTAKQEIEVGNELARSSISQLPPES